MNRLYSSWTSNSAERLLECRTSARDAASPLHAYRDVTRAEAIQRAKATTIYR